MALISENLWGDLDTKRGSGYDDQEKPYVSMDQAMQKYAEQSFADGEWEPEMIWKILGRLIGNRTMLAKYGVKRYFPRTVAFLRDHSGLVTVGYGSDSAGSEVDTRGQYQDLLLCTGDLYRRWRRQVTCLSSKCQWKSCQEVKDRKLAEKSNNPDLCDLSSESDRYGGRWICGQGGCHRRGCCWNRFRKVVAIIKSNARSKNGTIEVD